MQAQDENFFNKLSLEHSDMWVEFQQSGDLQLVSKLNLEPFESVVAVMALRPASLYRAIVGFVDRVLGTRLSYVTYYDTQLNSLIFVIYL